MSVNEHTAVRYLHFCTTHVVLFLSLSWCGSRPQSNTFIQNCKEAVEPTYYFLLCCSNGALLIQHFSEQDYMQHFNITTPTQPAYSAALRTSYRPSEGCLPKRRASSIFPVHRKRKNTSYCLGRGDSGFATSMYSSSSGANSSPCSPLSSLVHLAVLVIWFCVRLTTLSSPFFCCFSLKDFCNCRENLLRSRRQI